LVGSTDIARATIGVLAINQLTQTAIRKTLIEEGILPE
jgi:hypothetical protein